MAKKGKTLWEMLVEKFRRPVEYKFYNPLRARIGNAVTIDTVELRDYNFFLREIREYKRRIGPHQFVFADYAILARPLGGGDVAARIRLTPVADPERVAGLSHDVLLLRLDADMPYDEGLHQVVRDNTKKFQVLEKGVVVEEYWRINDVGSAYKAAVSVVRDANLDGKVEMAEVDRLKIEYWDYWREIKDEAGQAVTQYLFVEMDGESGWFQIWKGDDLDPKRVLVI